MVGREDDGNLGERLGKEISEENSIFSEVVEDTVSLLVSSSSSCWLKILISFKEYWFGSILWVQDNAIMVLLNSVCYWYKNRIYGTMIIWYHHILLKYFLVSSYNARVQNFLTYSNC